MTGNVAPDTVKPAPVIAVPLIVTATLPVDVNVTDCVAAVFSATLPNVRLVVLVFRIGVAAFNWRTKL